jgi:hypothetical protein
MHKRAYCSAPSAASFGVGNFDRQRHGWEASQDCGDVDAAFAR